MDNGKLQSVISGLLATVLAFSLFSSGSTASGSQTDPGRDVNTAPSVTLRAATGERIRFKAQDRPLVGSGSLPRRLLPHLVLRRNGALTDPDERTLIVEVADIVVPPPGVTVTLHVETQHADPDPRDGAKAGAAYQAAPDSERRIPVWREERWIPNPSRFAQTGATAVFSRTFGATVSDGTAAIATPTDYFRYTATLTDASHPLTAALRTLAGGRSASILVSRDHAFLMENQWIAPLPDVWEASPGAAPDELIVYYCDMFPFRKNVLNPETWLPRAEVSDYVRSDLVPHMIEAFRVQTDDWGFPWYQAWTSYRGGDDAERLSVALTDGRTWFHGRAPLRAHSGLSINVAGVDNAAYRTLTDGLMSSFHHELFHNLQRNLNMHAGGDGVVDGAQDAWQFFTEGTAVLASSVGQQRVQFRWLARAYLSKANGFLGYGRVGDLNRDYEHMNPYNAALYWRFLYEQCGRAQDGRLDPRAGMHVVRRALTILYAGEVVDPTVSTDLVRATPTIMDRALSTAPCSFNTHAESLAAFARAIYALRLEDGRCDASGIPVTCGFYDPHDQYYEPPIHAITYSGVQQQHVGEIPSSFGVDFVEVILHRAADGLPLMLEVHADPSTAASFSVQVWELRHPGGGARLQPASTPWGSHQIPPTTATGGGLSYLIPAIDTAESNRVGLIIARVDANQRLDPNGSYSIVLRPAHSDASLAALSTP